MKTIILMYHSIIKDNQKGKDSYCVPLSKFMEQMEYIKQCASLRVCELNELNLVHGPRSTVHSNVILTFDDGDVSNYKYAYPVLKVLGLKAYFFVIVTKIGKPGYINWQQLMELRDEGMIIGSHGMTHRIFTALNQKDIEIELRDSKRFLEDNLNIKIESLSIPRGFYNKKIIQKAKDIGYEEIFTSDLGTNNNGNFDLSRLQRIPIKRTLSIYRFSKILNGKRMVREKVEEVLKRTSQGILGIKNYEKITLKAYKWT